MAPRFTAYVRCYSRDWLGCEYSYGEFRCIVLLIDCNGEKTRTIVEIPRGRGPRSMTVTIP